MLLIEKYNEGTYISNTINMEDVIVIDRKVKWRLIFGTQSTWKVLLILIEMYNEGTYMSFTINMEYIIVIVILLLIEN